MNQMVPLRDVLEFLEANAKCYCYYCEDYYVDKLKEDLADYLLNRKNWEKDPDFEYYKKKKVTKK